MIFGDRAQTLLYEFSRLRLLRVAACALAIACSSESRPPDDLTRAALSLPAAPSTSPNPAPMVLAADTTQLDGPLVDLPAALKRADFRLNPPQVLAEYASLGPNGTTNILVTFGNDPRLESFTQIVLPIDNKRLVLARTTTENQSLDKTNGPSFKGNVSLPYARVLAAQQNLRKIGGKLKEGTIPVFSGRELMGVLPLPKLDELPGHIRLLPGVLSVVDAARSLTINEPSVIADPLRTFDPCTSIGAPLGPWTFGKLMTDMAGSLPPSDFVQRWLETFLSVQTINHLVVPAEPAIATSFPPVTVRSVLEAWPKSADGRLNLTRAPFKLAGIVNRIDLAGNPSYGAVAGAEGRLVFQMVDQTDAACRPLPFMVIFEFGVPRSGCSELQGWAQQWLNLSTLSVGSDAFDAALQAITDQFATANANPSKPNGSALNQLRTDVFTGFGVGAGSSDEKWQLREFHLGPSGTGLVLLNPAPLAQTPDAHYDEERGYLGSAGHGTLAPQLGAWILDNVVATFPPTLTPTYTVPLSLPCPIGTPPLPCTVGQPFRGGVINNNLEFWTAPGPSTAALRVFSLNTCDGCHSTDTGTLFRHLGLDSGLSGFLRGITLVDRDDHSVTHTFNDLLRRQTVLVNLASGFCGKEVLIPPGLRELLFPMPLPPLMAVPILSAH
jgi:hypothetical protein